MHTATCINCHQPIARRSTKGPAWFTTWSSETSGTVCPGHSAPFAHHQPKED